MRVLVCAGGTGGGIYPALAAVGEMADLGVSKQHILWLGVRGEMEERLVPRAGIQLETLTGGPIAGVSRVQQAKSLIKLSWAVVQSCRWIRRFRPDVLLVTGGYMAVPVALAAHWLRVPALVFVPDIEPGSAIKTILRWDNDVAATFAETTEYLPLNKGFVTTGYPVRGELRDWAQRPKTDGLAQFDLDPEKQTLFVFGGSRGAWSINQALMTILPELLNKIQVIHVSGTLTWDKVEAFSQTLPESLRKNYRPFPYLHEEMGAAFLAADLVVARGGASMLGECPLFGLPAVIVPYPHAWRYQKINADYLADRGAAVRLNDEDLAADLQNIISGLIDDTGRLAAMSEASRALRTPNAARALATAVLDTAAKNKQST